MNELFIGFSYKRPVSQFGISFYVVTIIETGEKRHVMGEDFHSFIVENGFANADAIAGGCYCDAEVLSELGFTLPKSEVLTAC